jgi:hypothetical protein
VYILHIGRHKTGTSSIQHFLTYNREALAKRGLIYPKPKRGVAHHNLAGILREVQLGEAPIPDLDAYTDELRRLKLNGTVLLSSEGFQNISPPLVRRMLGGEPATIIVYLREQFSYMWASYTQSVKAKLITGTFDHYAKRLNPNYLAFLNRWEAAFGAENLRVRIYEPGSFPDGDVVTDFLAQLQVERDDGLKSVPVQNVSLGWRLVNLKRAINIVLSEQPSCAELITPIYHLLNELAAEQPALREKPLFPAELVSDYQAPFQASNRAVIDKYIGRGIDFELAWKGDSAWLDQDERLKPVRGAITNGSNTRAVLSSIRHIAMSLQD